MFEFVSFLVGNFRCVALLESREVREYALEDRICREVNVFAFELAENACRHDGINRRVTHKGNRRRTHFLCKLIGIGGVSGIVLHERV